MKIRLAHACGPSCALCTIGLVVDAQALASSPLAARLEHGERTHQRRVFVQGRDLANNPHLAPLARAAAQHSLELALIEEGTGSGLAGRAQALRQMGVVRVYLTPFGDTESAGQPSRVRRAVLDALLALRQQGRLPVGLHIGLGPRSPAELPVVLRVHVRLAIDELLISVPLDRDGRPAPVEAAALVGALDDAWRTASAQHVRLRCLGFEHTRYARLPAGSPARLCDASLVDMIRDGIPLPSPRAGIQSLGESGQPSALRQLARTVDELKQLAFELAALRCPMIDIPACLGGVPPSPHVAPGNDDGVKTDACRRCAFDAACCGASPRLALDDRLPDALRPPSAWEALGAQGRVLILSAEGEDAVLYASTLPALADALRRRQADVEIVSPWLSRFDPTVPPLNQRTVPDWKRTSGVETWLATHDINAFALIIVSDFPTAELALAAAGAASAARIVVVDFHMLKDIDALLRPRVAPNERAADGGWWPSRRLVLESGFPGYVELYRRYGVPLEQVAWQPFALYPVHFPPGPDPTSTLARRSCPAARTSATSPRCALPPNGCRPPCIASICTPRRHRSPTIPTSRTEAMSTSPPSTPIWRAAASSSYRCTPTHTAPRA
ncbi:MAG: hypothetical protein ABI629_15425 [bacterium]